MLPFIVVGLASGAVYGLAGVGLVVVYRTTGLFNFAYGAFAAVAAYIFWDLRNRSGWPWPAAAVAAILAVGVVGGLGFEALAQALESAGTVVRVAATLAVALLLQGLLWWRYGTAVIPIDGFLPSSTIRLFGANIGWDQVIAFAFGSTATALLVVFLQRARTGIAMRGLVDNASLLGLAGYNARSVRRAASFLGCAFAAASGLLIAPRVHLDVAVLTALVVQAFAAAAIGRFRSLPWTYIGGLGLGVGSAIITKYSSIEWLQRVPAALPFIMLFGVLLLARTRGDDVRTQANLRVGSGRSRTANRRLSVALAVAGVAFLVLVPITFDTRLPTYTNLLILTLVFLSLAWLVTESGQISLCHAAFAAIGATTFAHLRTGLGLPWGLALLMAGMIVVPIGAFLAVPAIRLSRLHLALATLAFGILVEKLGFRMGIMFGGGKTQGIRRVQRPIELTDRGYYWLCLAIVVAAAAALLLLRQTRLGRLTRAMRDSPAALEHLGVRVSSLRVVVFCMSASLAAVAGALLASLTQIFSFQSFPSGLSLTWVTILVICGYGVSLVSASVAAAASLTIIPLYIGGVFEKHQALVFGAGALLVIVIRESLAQRAPSGKRAVRGRDRQLPMDTPPAFNVPREPVASAKER